MNAEKVNVEIIRKDHYKDGKRDEQMDHDKDYYTVNIVDGKTTTTFNIETNKEGPTYNYIIKTNTGWQQSETNFVYLGNEDDLADTQHIAKFETNSDEEKPTLDIKNIMKILQYSKCHDFKNKQVDITYVRPKWVNERQNPNIHEKDPIRKKITNFDFNEPKNIYSPNSLLDKIALKTKRIGDWFSKQFDALHFWFLKRELKAIQDQQANMSLSSVNLSKSGINK
ncbi:MAG: hypothetical protein IJT15_04290 [Rickettsiales bacterium]|nr:hypothetical protein [Rickettsiales bacterium]